MTQDECLDELGGTCPPQVPLRNPLRGDTRYQTRRRLTSAHSVDNANTPLPSMTSTTFPDSDCASGFTHEKFVSALETHFQTHRSSVNEQVSMAPSEGARMEKSTPPGKTSQNGPAPQAADENSPRGTKSSLTDNFQRYPSLRGRRDAPVLYGEDERQAKQRETEEAIARIRRSLDISDSFTNISTCDDEPRRQLKIEEREEEARVEAWLQLGALDIQTSKSDCASQLNKAKAVPVPIPNKPHALSLFPPTSPKTGKREYSSPLASPLSPMNNGRDAYGNFIPTNTRDYFAAPPTSVSSKLQPIVEDTPELQKSSGPSLRGGGGWWNPLNIGQAGKEPAVTQQSRAGTLTPDHRNNPAQNVMVKIPVGTQDHSSNRSDMVSESMRVGDITPRGVVVTKNPTLYDKEESQSHESDQNVLYMPPRRSSKQWEPSGNAQFGSVQNRRKSNVRTPLPTSPSQNYIGQGTTRASYATHATNKGRPLSTDEYANTDDMSQSVPDRPCVNAERLDSPLSDVSYSPRTKKRWNRGPASPAPSQLALPAVPPHKDTKSEVASFVGPMRTLKYEYEHDRPRSEAESYHDETWEVRSLQFGESVSAAGWAPRPPHAPQVLPIRSENFEAEQKEAMIRFRPLCQDVMVQYNAETSRINRSLQIEELSPEQFERQAEHLMKNRENALRYSAQSSGYVILADESSILEALNDPNGYAIYHDLLSTTNPTLWSRLESQHGQAQIQIIQARPTTDRPKFRESSLTSARRVGGKIARFILAAPSDPDLKTSSSRRHVDWNTTSMPLPWMDPMAMVGLSSPIDIDGEESWTFRSLQKKAPSRDKGKAKSEPGGETTTGYEFLAAGPAIAVQVAKRAAATGKNIKTHWTGTTAAPQPLDRPTKPTRQLPSFNPAYNAYKRHSTTESIANTDNATEVSLWPEGDSEGNWTIPKRVTMRGGDGKWGVDRKLKKEHKATRKAKAKEEQKEMEKYALIDRVGFGRAGEWGIRL